MARSVNQKNLQDLALRIRLMGQQAMEGKVTCSRDIKYYTEKLAGNYNRLMMHTMNQEMADQANQRITDRLFNTIALVALAS